MKIEKMGWLEFVELDLMDMQNLDLMDLVACGQHSDRRSEGGVWDLTCYQCALRYETAKDLASRIATRLHHKGQEIPGR